MANDNSKQRILLGALGTASLLLLACGVLWAEGQGQRKPPGFLDVLTLPRVWMGAIFCAIGLVLLAKSWVSLRLRLLILLAAFFVFSLVSTLPLGKFAAGMGLHPNPVCTVTRPFEFMNAGRSVPIIFWAILTSIAVFTLVGNKLFCGWVCPIGAIQEISHRIPLPRGFKLKLPFGASNLIRVLIFVAFIVTVFLGSLNIYDYFNPFEFLHWGFGLVATVAIVATIAAGAFIFRPFCYLICPLGLFTWILEHLSLVKVQINETLCTKCNICIHQSPCPAVPAILEGRRSRPDCHACGRCIEVCPEKALAFRK